jgi:Protein of unknown function (DUF3738)
VFNYRLEFESIVDAGPSPSGLSIFTAVEEQLGMRLRSTTGPVTSWSSIASSARPRIDREVRLTSLREGYGGPP